MAEFRMQSAGGRWGVMVEACKRAARSQGFALEREPGRGLSNIWNLCRAGMRIRSSFRTSQDRWIAFAPTKNGAEWKTLDDVEKVIFATVDDKANPRNVEVYLFDRDEVRARFVAAYAARANAGQSMTDGFGFWVNGDPDDRGIAQSVGAGLLSLRPPIAVYDIAKLMMSTDTEMVSDVSHQSARPAEHQPGAGPTIAEVLKDARKTIAQLSGLPIEAVRLELKLEQ
jgi:hypothetical protein